MCLQANTTLCAGMITREARVACFQIRHQFSRARVNIMQSGVWNGNVAGDAPRTLAIQLWQNVRRAADAAVVLAHATAELHAAVPGRRHHDHVTGQVPAAGVECLEVAVFAHLVHCAPVGRRQKQRRVNQIISNSKFHSRT